MKRHCIQDLKSNRRAYKAGVELSIFEVPVWLCERVDLGTHDLSLNRSLELQEQRAQAATPVQPGVYSPQTSGHVQLLEAELASTRRQLDDCRCELQRQAELRCAGADGGADMRVHAAKEHLLAEQVWRLIIELIPNKYDNL
jgi:hypothetical protein